MHFILDGRQNINIFSIISTLSSITATVLEVRRRCLILVAVLLAHPDLASGAEVAYTQPSGFVKIEVHPGTGGAKRTTLFSVPLFGEASIEGRTQGVVTQVGATSITSAGAGWRPGEISEVSAPHLLEITSGQHAGRIFTLSASTPNTSDTIFIESSEVEVGQTLSELGISVGDGYKIWPADTLGSLFGPAREGGIQGGGTPQTSDTIIIVSNGTASTYFFNTNATPPRWTKVGLGSPDATHTIIPPYAAVQYARVANTALTLVAAGTVPYGQRLVRVKSSGTTLLSSHWAAEQTLDQLALETTTGWRTGASAQVADTVVLVTRGGASTYFHDGLFWRRVSFGAPLSGMVKVPVGGGILVSRKGSGMGHDYYRAGAPYSFTP